MGKEKPGFLTPKAIANRIKAKGLQKLRWYCQMCQKQCRDENGFKCHLTSESHQRQLLLFAENPDKHIDDFSQNFETEYLELLRRRFGTKRVHANIVYQEYIAFREHVHMNSTQWETLTEFVKYLGKEGKCLVDYTEKGWFITYIDRDPETIRKQEAIKAKEKMDATDDERISKFIEKQIERAKDTSTSRDVEFTDLNREDESEKITFNLAAVKKVEPVLKHPEASSSSNPLVSTKKVTEKTKPPTSSKAGEKRKAKTALDEIMEAEEQKKEKINRKDYWLCPGIVVKVVHKKLGEKYYKKKAVVKEVKDLYTGIIKMLDSGDKLKVDQTHVETVIPGLGKPVMVVNGAYRGEEATLDAIDEKHFCCSIIIKHGLLTGRVVNGVQYEDICKLHLDS
ncbi:DNA/RNA-binding protein KIN17-like [Physella acuta]|uniref:DNA/RNA-binding protein KIN17-like n=1 Tax=Physella acuta TaxID=109671 RepID=UPI0027DBCCF0|nr:DNA/RNA-binding protein KIN17-like [Physella acuta]XP_059150414.1 DNA/RNA-binding protein KIN17-like [Physella acuta]XP_059150415.1 DNA/RNA-binding protein KIN17-like [Physella acuta]